MLTRGLRTFTTSVRSFKNYGIPQNPPVSSDSVEMKILPIKREGEDISTKRARLIYQSRKRGILELDLLLSKFAKKHLSSLSMEELDEFDTLLDESDWDIFYWATKNFDVTPLPKRWENSSILKLLQEESENREKEILRMPELSKELFLEDHLDHKK